MSFVGATLLFLSGRLSFVGSMLSFVGGGLVSGWWICLWAVQVICGWGADAHPIDHMIHQKVWCSILDVATIFINQIRLFLWHSSRITMELNLFHGIQGGYACIHM